MTDIPLKGESYLHNKPSMPCFCQKDSNRVIIYTFILMLSLTEFWGIHPQVSRYKTATQNIKFSGDHREDIDFNWMKKTFIKGQNRTQKLTVIM